MRCLRSVVCLHSSTVFTLFTGNTTAWTRGAFTLFTGDRVAWCVYTAAWCLHCLQVIEQRGVYNLSGLGDCVSERIDGSRTHQTSWETQSRICSPSAAGLHHSTGHKLNTLLCISCCCCFRLPLITSQLATRQRQHQLHAVPCRPHLSFVRGQALTMRHCLPLLLPLESRGVKVI